MNQVMRGARKAGTLSVNEQFIGSIHQPQSRTFGSRVLHSSQGGDRGRDALRTEWAQPIFDPPTLEGYQSYKRGAHAWNIAQDTYKKGVKMGGGLQNLDYVAHADLVVPAAQWRDAAEESARGRTAHILEHPFRAYRSRDERERHETEIANELKSAHNASLAVNRHGFNAIGRAHPDIFNSRWY
ncbi:hypothetical protein MMC17_009878 [Xylographa soralifera]|nr:hypothetical protein [Xylographa soralifera]